MNTYLVKRRDAGADTPTPLNTSSLVRRSLMSEADSTARVSQPQLPKRAKDHTGKQFGRWLVLSFFDKGTGGCLRWLCRCECGTERPIAATELVSGRSSSCGCLRAEMVVNRCVTHGMTGTAIHAVWLSMKKRCLSPTDKGYECYGGRGIRVCQRWADSFEDFITDMGPRPSNKHSIDRINNDGDYEPSNCRWATKIQQGRNTRSNINIFYQGKTQCLAAWAEELGIPYKALAQRISIAGWSPERAFTTPLQVKRRTGKTNTEVKRG